MTPKVVALTPEVGHALACPAPERSSPRAAPRHNAEGKLKHNAARFSKVGRTPWSAGGPLAGNASMIHEAAPIDEERVRDPCGPGGPPYFAGLAAIFGKNERH
jgi:hypothetical protein